MLLLWALCLSTAFALLVTKLVACRKVLGQEVATNTIASLFAGDDASCGRGLGSSMRTPPGSHSGPRFSLGSCGSSRAGPSGGATSERTAPAPLAGFSCAPFGRRSPMVGDSMSETGSDEEERGNEYHRPQPLSAYGLRSQAPSPTPLFSGFAFTAAPSARQPARMRLERHCLRPLLVQFLALLEGATAWVTGCAWTDAIVAWTSLAAYPTPLVAVKTLVTSVVISVLGVSWLVFSGRSNTLSDEKKGSREEVELFFATNACVFVVGWCWICMTREVSMLATVGIAGHTQVWVRYTVAAIVTFIMGPLIGILVAVRT